MTPNIAILQIHNPHWRGLRLWVPLFLLWIPAILLGPLILLIFFAVCIAGEIDTFHAIRVCWGIACALRGTNIHVRADENQVLVRIL